VSSSSLHIGVRDTFEPASSCADVERRLLDFVDQRGHVAPDDLITEMQRLACPSGHPFRVGDLMRGQFKVASDGTVSLSRRGSDWLSEYGRPAPKWPEQAHSKEKLRAWQIEALDAWAAHGRRGVVEAVTGTGNLEWV
jgi:hypothetical protein